MLDLVTEASTLGVLLEETRGVVGVVLGTDHGEVRGVVGAVRDSDTGASVAAALSSELNRIGSLLGLGELGVVSIKAASAARVVAQQSGAVLVIELDPKRPLGELETKLRTLAWAPDEDQLEAPAITRAVTTQGGPPRIAHPRPPSAPPINLMPPPPASSSPLVQAVASVSALSAAGLPPLGPSPNVPPPPPLGLAQPHLAQTAPLPVPVPPPLTSGPLASSPSLPVAAVPERIGPASSSPSLLPPSIRPPRPSPPPARVPPPPPPPAAVHGSSVAPQSKSVGSGPAFAGDLEEFSLPDLLEFLRNSHRTGLLVCSTTTGTGTVQLSRGMIISADSPHALDLREHFVFRAEIAPELRRMLSTLPAECFSDDMIESVLVSRDLVPRDELERARVARIYSAFREMMGWTSGRFSFDPAVPIVTNPALALSAQSILMQIYQEQDEQEQGR
jgi:predicted regulator of Ras-like GTPase activity (Roadblock/LC7/MglB family)